MIYERGSLESRAMKMPSAWKSNKHPLWISEWGGGMYRKPFTGWSCIKQTSSPQIFMGRDLLINLSLSSISLFCIHQELEAVIGYNHLHCVHIPTWGCLHFWADYSAYVQQIMSQLNIWASDFAAISVWFRNQILNISDEGVKVSGCQTQGFSGRGVWMTHRLTGSLHKHRCLSQGADTLPLVIMAADLCINANSQVVVEKALR